MKYIYNKLVRDKIPENINSMNDRKCNYKILKGWCGCKLKYIQKIKSERNLAQDQVKELLDISGYSDFQELKKYLKKYRQSS